MLNADAIKQQVHNLILQHPELADDEVLRADMLEGATDLHEAFDALTAILTETEGTIAATEERERVIAERRERLKRRAERLKEVMHSLLDASGLKRVETAEATIYVRNNPAKVVIVDEDAIPERFFKTKTQRVLSKSDVGAVLRVGEEVPGAALGNGGVSIIVRRD